MRTANFLRWQVSKLFAFGVLVCSLAPNDLTAEEKKPAVKVTISPETTLITKPLRPNGYPDYLAALNDAASEDVTPENNAAVLFWQAMGPAMIRKALREEYFKRLGIAPLPASGEYFVDMLAFVKKHPEFVPKVDGVTIVDIEVEQWANEQGTRADSKPWTTEELPFVAAWLAANEKPLKLIVEGTRRPRIFDPLINADPNDASFMVSLPQAQSSRIMANALIIRAFFKIGQKQYQSAWEDILACHRLAYLIGQNSTIVDGIVAQEILGLAFRGSNALLASGGLTAVQAKAMKEEIQFALKPHSFKRYFMVMGRYFFLDTACRVAESNNLEILHALGRGMLKKEVETGWKKASDNLILANVDWNSMLRIGNRNFDKINLAWDQDSLAKRKAAFEELKIDGLKFYRPELVFAASLDSTGKIVTEWIANFLCKQFVNWLPSVMDTEEQGNTYRQLLKVEFELAIYKAKHGKYPDQLSQLVPDYLPKVPLDGFGQGELIYRPKKDGYLLYSVGKNGTDDDGKNAYYDENTAGGRSGNSRADDLRLSVPMR